MTVAEVDGVVAGFVMVAGDEVEQVYVDRAFRGTGLAEVLLDEAERQVADAGHRSAWLPVVVGNARHGRSTPGAAGATRATSPTTSVALGEHFTSPCRRYVKDVAPA